MSATPESCGYVPVAAALLGGSVFLSSALVSLVAITQARSGEKSEILLNVAEAFCWLSVMCASMLVAYAALDLPELMHAWRLSRCRP